MKFFLPLAISEAQAERVYIRIINRLEGMGYKPSAHRVASVIYRREGKRVSASVGAPSDNGEIVLAIFKNDIGYFVCTYSKGAVWGEPITIRYSMVESAVGFDQDDFDDKRPG